MAKMKKRTFEKEYVQIPNETAKAPEIKNNEKPISLEALGLLVNLWSYDVENWDLHKTELYKRFAFNKERSVKRIWDELIEAGYMIEFKYRDGSKWEFVYIYNILPYTEEQHEIIMAESREEYGEISGLQNADLKNRTAPCRPQEADIINTKEKKYKSNKNNKTLVNKENATHLENYSFKDELIDLANEFYSEFASSRWSKKQWNTLIAKFIDEIIENEIYLKNPRAYIYSALKGIAHKHDLKNGKVDFEDRLKNSSVPFYNWLES